MKRNTTPVRTARALALLGAILSVCLTSPALAQGTPSDVLRGPSVPEESTRQIGGDTMTGRFERVEGRPEFAAAGVLDLDDDTRERIRAIRDARDGAVVDLLIDELDLVREMSDLVIAGEQERAGAMMPVLWDQLEPGQPMTPCVDAIEAALPEAHRADYRRVLGDYLERWVASQVRGREGAEQRVRDRLALSLFQQEIREAYDRSLRHYREAMDAIYEAVEPTDEQRAQIREIVLEHIKRTRLAATPADRHAVMLRVYRMLDEDRRERLFGYLLRVAVPSG